MNLKVSIFIKSCLVVSQTFQPISKSSDQPNMNRRPQSSAKHKRKHPKMKLCGYFRFILYVLAPGRPEGTTIASTPRVNKFNTLYRSFPLFHCHHAIVAILEDFWGVGREPQLRVWWEATVVWDRGWKKGLIFQV